jgi:signal transduction histidine kinase
VKLLSEQSRTITFALHLFIVAGLLTVWGARPGDAIFRWLAVIGTTSLIVVIAEFRPFPAIIDIARPWLVMILSSFGLMMIGLALAISEMPRPRWLLWLIVGFPISLILLYATGLLPLPATVLPSVAFAIGGHVVAGVILIHTFARQREWVYGFLAVPFFLTAWFGIRDVAVVFELIPGGFLLSTFVRPVTYLSVLVLLMYKLASSLNRLDQANDVLRTRLAAQEAELSALHAKEKVLVGQTVREQERQRLMRDLHDGLSGYLVSIIAMSEKHGRDVDIERTAREALEDLRLVIHSLDLGDTDLPLALAGFRERLSPRLRRLGVTLTWSMERLPEIQGVTPENALSVLRILQEAVTNALKHGPARAIHIEGSPGTSDTALLSITNDGPSDISSGTGNGLSNMQRRAQKLGGYISTTKSAKGYELQLSLPRRLPKD